MKREKESQSGFTLWELLLVLSIMGVLLITFTPHFDSAANRVRVQVDLANVTKIEGAAQLYKIDVGEFPLRVADLVYSPIGVSGWRGPYLKEVLQDPFDSTISYQLDGLGRVKARTNLSF